jgi:hypothetical protein
MLPVCVAENDVRVLQFTIAIDDSTVDTNVDATKIGQNSAKFVKKQRAKQFCKSEK